MKYKYPYAERLAFVRLWANAISDLGDAIEAVEISNSSGSRQRQRAATEKLRQFNERSVEMFSTT